MEVCIFTIECDFDRISSDLDCLVVQRLRDVAEEVDEELEGFFAVFGREAAILDALSLHNRR